MRNAIAPSAHFLDCPAGKRNGTAGEHRDARFLQTGNGVLIGGSTIGRNQPAKALLGAIGPSLPVDGRLQVCRLD